MFCLPRPAHSPDLSWAPSSRNGPRPYHCILSASPGAIPPTSRGAQKKTCVRESNTGARFVLLYRPYHWCVFCLPRQAQSPRLLGGPKKKNACVRESNTGIPPTSRGTKKKKRMCSGIEHWCVCCSARPAHSPDLSWAPSTQNGPTSLEPFICA